MDKKSVIDPGSILLIVIIVLFFGWLINNSWKECRVDSDCGGGQYCGSDFDCHDFKVVVKEIKVVESNVNTAAWILGLLIVISALIMKWDSIFAGKKKKKEQKDENNEGYVDLSRIYKAEDECLYEKDYSKE
ncbi:MAG: hypothetical protein KAK00_09425 [Nanoarchaeota archaeon]|nr:hypothetical protein [Nanoarchaeota archaeon]